jgi:streptomycin 6-kinase
MNGAEESGGDITVPRSFLEMPRWWAEGAQWLADLPQIVRSQCLQWGLRIGGDIAHGSNAVVVPVTRGDQKLVLRLAPPGDEVAEQAAALRFWAGRGTVCLLDADPEVGTMLLERLGMGQSLCDVPVREAIPVLGRMMRRLAVPAPAEAPSTAALVRTRAGLLEADWHRLGEPFESAFLFEALRVAGSLSRTDSDLAVNGDLHSAQVLRGRREPWLAVDPVLLRGDVEYDLARVLWTRIDEMADAAAVVGHFDVAVQEAGVDPDRARAWVVFRTVDYWLWGLRIGLTEDPERCRRLIAAFYPPNARKPRPPASRQTPVRLEKSKPVAR